MLELFLNGEIRPSRLYKLALLLTPFLFLLLVAAFVAYAR